MKTKLSILLLVVTFLIPLNMQGQIGNYLKKKVDRAINTAGNKADNEVNNEVDKAAEGAVTGTKNTIFDSIKKKGDSDTTAVDEGEEGGQQAGRSGQKKSGFGGFGLGKVTAKYDENYDFKGLIKMKTELYDKGKPEGTVDVDMWFNTTTNSLGMETSTVTSDEGQAVNATAVVDMKNKVMITIANIDGSKSGMIMLIPDSVANTTQTSDEVMDNTKIRKTGNSRTICGYRCDEYEVIEDDGKTTSNVWVTDDLKLKGDSKLLSSQQGMPRAYGKIKGAIMASETYEKGVIVSKMEVTKIDMNATHSISVAGASLIQMDMSKFGQKKKK